MEIAQLRTFTHVAELGSLSKAAGRLRIAQPALSRQIRMLEEELGVRLFERHGRGMIITEQGRGVLQHATRVLAELDELKASAAGSEAPLSGHVAIGISPTVADVISVPFVTAFRTQYPGIMVQLVSAYTGYLLDSLYRGEIDLAVLYDPKVTRSLRSEPLMQESLFLIGPADMEAFGESGVSFAEMARMPLLLPSRRHGLRSILDRFADEAGVSLNVTVEMDSYAAMKDLVRHGHGYTILPLAPIYEDVTAGRLVPVPISNPSPTRQLVLSYPTDRPVSRAAQLAGESLTGIMVEHVSRGIWRGELLTRSPKDGGQNARL
ncbi:LysR family transcriptional regulator [Microvirga vignae]|uniref:LysR family transcriptional regulator n=1 Tax=Microvirga vignae TaxID=1225564 RepID=A0A0H1RIN8_9HYPH|nr:LysR substrate-binding domain-containing protein [Microvirga vignae]KLK94889.1 LysR family transcriptional regulator [Microvirga vignae]